MKYTAFKLNIYNKIPIFFIKDYLKLAIYHHISQKDSLRDLSFGICISRKLVAGVSLSTLSYHNNKRNYQVFLPVLNELTNKVLNTGS